MVVVLFRSRLTPDAANDYGEMAVEMAETAKGMPGFVDVKSFKAEDGERLTLVWWQDQETLGAWKSHPRHLIAQRTGREKWYEYYKMDVAEVVRNVEFERKAVSVA
jgi:heme-degrading monooxygenase HmoA